ncbi:monocarboxylate transporter 12-like isoform X1 [Patiria miniata]|uniref:Major facilitator superfamily (MFS) profile domain-containing protein n=1 Tax=Patiria miniata TaxID=46514 RepID=A0A914AQY6_PATMI|nr:monocarboxylate transporter 12-like isoform X1 [Patiria miniata]
MNYRLGTKSRDVLNSLSVTDRFVLDQLGHIRVHNTKLYYMYRIHDRMKRGQPIKMSRKDRNVPSLHQRERVGGPQESQDGGPQSWFAVLAAWMTWFFWGGLLKGLGVLVPTLQVQFATSTWIIGWIVAMLTGSVGLSGIFAGPLGKRFGSGVVFIISGLLVSWGFMMTAFTLDSVQLALLQTLIAGPGLGFANVLSREAVGRCFSDNYATASAISQTGLSAAMLICAPVTQLFLDTYGWRGTLLLLGGSSMHLVVCGQLLHKILPPTKQRGAYDLLSSDETSDQRAAQGTEDHCGGRSARELGNECWQLARSAVQHLDCQLFCDVQFWLIFIWTIGTLFPFEMWYIYFISLAQSKGFSPTDAAVFVTYAGIGNVVLKIVHAPVVDRRIIKMRPMIVGSMVLSFASLVVTPWNNAYWSMALSACVFMACTAIFANLHDVLIKEVLGKDRMACAFGWVGIIFGAIRIAFGFFPGWIYDQTGSYDLAFLILAGLQPLGLIALLCLRYTETAPK